MPRQPATPEQKYSLSRMPSKNQRGLRLNRKFPPLSKQKKMSSVSQLQPSPFLSSLSKDINLADLLKLDPPSEPVKAPKRCCAEGCKKKLSLTDFACRCGKIHCSMHRQAELHACTYDYKKDGLKVLEKQLGEAVIAKKLDRV